MTKRRPEIVWRWPEHRPRHSEKTMRAMVPGLPSSCDNTKLTELRRLNPEMLRRIQRLHPRTSARHLPECSNYWEMVHIACFRPWEAGLYWVSRRPKPPNGSMAWWRWPSTTPRFNTRVHIERRCVWRGGLRDITHKHWILAIVEMQTEYSRLNTYWIPLSRLRTPYRIVFHGISHLHNGVLHCPKWMEAAFEQYLAESWVGSLAFSTYRRILGLHDLQLHGHSHIHEGDLCWPSNSERGICVWKLNAKETRALTRQSALSIGQLWQNAEGNLCAHLHSTMLENVLAIEWGRGHHRVRSLKM